MRSMILNRAGEANDAANDSGAYSRTQRRISVALWIVQVLLALLFVFAGSMKLVMPIEAMTKDMPMPGWFLRFIGIAELFGGLGMILPGLTRIQPKLTPLAATGLVVIMIGATVLTAGGGIAMAVIPFVTLALCAFVAYGRWRVAPHRGR